MRVAGARAGNLRSGSTALASQHNPTRRRQNVSR